MGVAGACGARGDRGWADTHAPMDIFRLVSLFVTAARAVISINPTPTREPVAAPHESRRVAIASSVCCCAACLSTSRCACPAAAGRGPAGQGRMLLISGFERFEREGEVGVVGQGRLGRVGPGSGGAGHLLCHRRHYLKRRRAPERSGLSGRLTQPSAAIGGPPTQNLRAGHIFPTFLGFPIFK